MHSSVQLIYVARLYGVLRCSACRHVARYRVLIEGQVTRPTFPRTVASNLVPRVFYLFFGHLECLGGIGLNCAKDVYQKYGDVCFTTVSL